MQLIPRAQQGQLQHSSWSYGASVNGLPLRGFGPRKASPDLLIMAAMHGDEADTVLVLSEALRQVPETHMANPVILNVNPDGVLNGTRCNARGIDLNRNYPADNWAPDTVHHRSSAGEAQDIELSPGNVPGSEPETQALIALIEELQPRIVVTLHSALGCIDDPDATRLGHWVSQQVNLEVVPDVGYPTPGSFGSWARERERPVLTWELPAHSIPELRKSHVPVLIKLITGDYPAL